MITVGNMFSFLIVIYLIYFVSFIVSLWKIFEKENIIKWYSLIPFLNLYYYLKICKIPFWTTFIPLVNLVVLFCSPYRIAYEYDQKKYVCILAMFFPFIVLLYLAFSKAQNKKMKNNILSPLKTIQQIDNLENDLENNFELENIDFYEPYSTDTNNSNFFSTTDSLINGIENNIQDDLFFDAPIYDQSVVQPGPAQNINQENTCEDEDLIELFDSAPTTLNSSAIDKIEHSILSNNKNEYVDNTNYKEYESVAPSTEAIAFGGEQQIENTYSSQAKNDELKCPRCGSSLVGAKGICPGCGMQV